MSTIESAQGRLNGARGTLGILWLVYGIFRLFMGIVLFVFHGTATVMFGALLSRVSNPYALMADFHIIYVSLIILALITALFGVMAGVALLSNHPVARTLALAAAFLSVSEIPFGATLGIYTLIVLLPQRIASPLK